MIEYIILGIVQGLTEFLPVSSSGHLVLLQKLFGITGEEVSVSIILHLGTLAAVCMYFFKDIVRAIRDIRMLGYIIVVTLITGAIGVAGKDYFEGLFSSLETVSIAWLVTGILLVATKRFSKTSHKSPNLADSLILGVTQAAAIIPGISRSGTTIATLLFRGLSAETAFSFSFIVSLPAVLGATVLEAKKVGFAMEGNTVALSAGLIASVCTGLVSLMFLKRMLDKARFHWFGYYCIGIAVVTFIFLSFN